MSFQLIIFDLDGTLVDSKIDIANSVRHTLKELGLRDVSPEIIYTFVGRGVEPLIRNSLAEAGGGDIEAALKLFRAHYREHMVEHSAPFPQVEEVLRQLSNFDKVVLTNKLQDLSREMLEKLSLAPFFLDVFGGDSFSNKKPDPEGIRHIIQMFRSKPENTLIVGDSGVDIEAGNRAGITTCGVTYGYRSVEELLSQGPDYMVDSFPEIIDIISS